MRNRTISAAITTHQLAGCSHSPTAPKVASAPPPPSTPLGVATHLQNVWQGMAPGQYPALLAGDFAFDFAPGDSSWLGPWVRADEESCAVHMFRTGMAHQPPATSRAPATWD